MTKKTTKQSSRLTRLLMSTGVITAFMACSSQKPVDDAAAPPVPPLGTAEIVAIQVYYKLDTRLTAGIYMGERWVSPRTYHSTLQPGAVAAVEVKAVGMNSWQQPVEVNLVWQTADADIVTLSADEGRSVILSAHGAGETTVRVSSGNVSKLLTISSIYAEEPDISNLKIIQEESF